MTRPLTFILHANQSREVSGAPIGPGAADFALVKSGFVPLLKRLGLVVEIEQPETQVDTILDELGDRGETCLFFHFATPFHFLPTIPCPTVLVFPWGYDTIPTDHWGGDGRHDWRAGLRAAAGAIVHSRHAVHAVKAAMGDDYPVAAVPRPTFDMWQERRAEIAAPTGLKKLSLSFTGQLADSRDMRLVPHAPDPAEAEELAMLDDRARYFLHRRWLELDARRAALEAREVALAARETAIARDGDHCSPDSEMALAGAVTGSAPGAPGRAGMGGAAGAMAAEAGIGAGLAALLQRDAETPPHKPNMFYAEGVIYTADLDPSDPCAGWRDMVTAFCAAFRATDDAALIIKACTQNIARGIDELMEHLRRLNPFSCRVVIVSAELDGAAYERLLTSTSFYVNTSSAEGQCLPLMDAMALGVPAIAPKTAAMADFMDETSGFTPSAHIEPTYWRHDPRRSYRAHHYRIDWPQLVSAFEESYRVARREPERYAQMSRAATEAMRRHNSLEVLSVEMRAFIDKLQLRHSDGADFVPRDAP